MPASFNETNWNLASANALLASGVSITLAPGAYSLGSGDEGLVLSNTSAKVVGQMKETVVLTYYGTGAAVSLKPGSTGTVESVTIKGNPSGLPAGKGVRIEGAQTQLHKVTINRFEYGVFYEYGVISHHFDLLFISCDIAIGHNHLLPLNLISFTRAVFRSNGVCVKFRSAHGVYFDYCDFEASRDEAINIDSYGSNATQLVVFNRCWIEGNNLSHASEDDTADVILSSTPGGGRKILSVIFRDTYFSWIGGSRPAQYHMRIGAADDAGVQVVGGFPLILTVDKL